MRTNDRVVVFAAMIVILGAFLGRPLAAGDPAEAKRPDIRQRYSELLRIVTIPSSDLPNDVRLKVLAGETPLIPVGENPGLMIEPERVKVIAGFFGLREASELESVRAAVTAVYEGEGGGPNEIGVYGIYISDRETAKQLFKKIPKDQTDFLYIRKGPLLLCLWRDPGAREPAFEAIHDYFQTAEFRADGHTNRSAVNPEESDDSRDPVEAVKGEREQIGAVFGEPVYRDQIREGKRLRSELYRLLTAPVWRKYREAHKEEVTPTEAEIQATAAYFMKKHPEQFKDNTERSRKGLKRIADQLAKGGLTSQEKRELEERKQLHKKRLKYPARSFAKFMLSHRKFQRHLYKHYGGGRLLWQQAGVEAFDAMWNWLKMHEKQGDFQITDPELRAELYEYWTSQDDRSSLIDEPERIRKFLYPEWAPYWDPRSRESRR